MASVFALATPERQICLRLPTPETKIAHAEIEIDGSVITLADECLERDSKSPQTIGGTHLRRINAVSGHHLQALDGELGHVWDFIIDDETWAIRYLIVDTHNWWPGKKVLVSPQWIERVSWGERKVFINFSRDTIKESPEYTGEFDLTRDYEKKLHGHYRRKAYWIDELADV